MMTTPNSLIVSVSGIRGIVGESLTPECALAFAMSMGTFVRGGQIVVSRDGRPSGEMMHQAVTAGLLAAGCQVYDLGVAPTPTVGIAVRKLNATGGIQITASHNPAPWNGLKLFGDEGRVLPAAKGKEVQEIYHSGAFRRADWDNLGKIVERAQATDWHLEKVLQQIDVAQIRARNPKVLLDANGGAGGPLGKQLLEAVGARAIDLGCAADGRFEHEPEPIEDNLRSICAQVADNDCDLAFVLDPDADRLALIDETGFYIGEELTLALAVRLRLEQQRGPVVVNMSTSRITEDLCKRFNVPFHRSAVGEANVVDKMIEVGAVMGGEGNGGVIDPRIGWVRDPFIGMGMILHLLAQSGQKLSELVAELPKYHIVKTKRQIVAADLPGLLERIEQEWPAAHGNQLDGLRLDWPDRWLHVRPSNTEPIVRVIAEAPSRWEAEQMCAQTAKLMS